MEIKLCKDCKHFSPALAHSWRTIFTFGWLKSDGYYGFARCQRPKQTATTPPSRDQISMFLVRGKTGKVERNNFYADLERHSADPLRCGLSGIHFERKKELRGD